MYKGTARALDDLRGRELAAVTFVRGYIQLGFDGPLLSLLLDPVVTLAGKPHARRDPTFCCAIVELVGQRVTSVEVRVDEIMTIAFDAGCSLRMSLRPEDYRFGPEAVTYLDASGSFWVF